MKTGVLVHGCNLNIENWRHVAWGDPPHELGRMPQGILIALQEQADTIVFGTGASEKVFQLGESDRKGQLLAEAEYSFEYLKANFEALHQFEPFVHWTQTAGTSLAEHKESILDRIVLDLESKNTMDEIEKAGEIFIARGIERVILVSSPSHIVRCLRDAASLYQGSEQFRSIRNQIFAVASQTCYEGTTASDVVVVEPPHRPDRHVVPTHRRIQRMLMLQRLGHQDLVELIEEFDDLLQKYEHRFFQGK